MIILPDGQVIHCPSRDVSDGHHTFSELYEHRHLLFINLMLSHPQLSWRAYLNDDGTYNEGMFLGGMKLPSGQVSYHLPLRFWPRLDNRGIETTNRAPVWDGHSTQDVIQRLVRWQLGGNL